MTCHRRYRSAAAWAGLCIALGSLVTGPARAEPLTADMSSNLISITSSFTGADLVLFGTHAVAGDVVIVVRGPASAQVVRRKTRVNGIWVNSANLTFTGVPGFYAVAANRALHFVAAPKLLEKLGIGAENLRLETAAPASTEDRRLFRKALIRNLRRERLFQPFLGNVIFLGDTLFRTNIEIPVNAPVGGYDVHFYLLRDGELIARQSTALFINKAGFERTIFDLANDRPAVYGLIAILLALIVGWIAATVFRRS